jgi:hypothetical protein
MQKWADGSPTSFREKIMQSLKSGLTRRETLDLLTTGESPKVYMPKYHTMRPSFMIKKGMMLDLAYWSGRPYHSSPERFVEQTPCVSTQVVKIDYKLAGLPPDVYVDGKLLGLPKLQRLAINDGFESSVKFFGHFNKSAEYNLIHWTTLRY